MCGSRKYPYPPKEGHWKFRGGGGGVFNSKNFQGKYEAKLEFPEGCGGLKVKNHLWGEYGYFLEQHNAK